jgi:hypothetical protein
MTRRTTRLLWIGLVASAAWLLPAVASAEDGGDAGDVDREGGGPASHDGPRARRYYHAGPIHGEFTMGFLAGGRTYADEAFTYDNGAGDIEGVGGLVEPFENAPFDRVLAFGLRYDLRLVVSYVRMTAGVDLPFASFQAADTRARYDVEGTDREIVVQELRPYELRFGIGGEYTFGPVTPFVDLLGSMHWVGATLSVDGERTVYRASAFGFAVRAGLRAHLRDWFFLSLSGEVGIVDDVLWGAELSVGFAVG